VDPDKVDMASLKVTATRAAAQVAGEGAQADAPAEPDQQ
jgi:hypothetical protein